VEYRCRASFNFSLKYGDFLDSAHHLSQALMCRMLLQTPSKNLVERIRGTSIINLFTSLKALVAAQIHWNSSFFK